MKRFPGVALAVVLVWSSAASAIDGKLIYASSCATCHAQGVAGAPRLSDRAAWATRIALGKAALTQSVLRGKGAMPIKGGNASLSEVDVKAAVDFMWSELK